MQVKLDEPRNRGPMFLREGRKRRFQCMNMIVQLTRPLNKKPGSSTDTQRACGGVFIVEVMTPLVLYIQQNVFFVKSNKLNIA